MDADIRQLVSYCRERAGDDLRVVIRYHGEDTDYLYLRDDLKDEYSPEMLDPLVGQAQTIHGAVSVIGEGSTLGDDRASVHVYEEGIVLQFTISPSEGVIVSFEPEVGRGLLTFINGCLERFESIDTGRPQVIDTDNDPGDPG